ncbi:sorting and assembly machinery component 50 homolog [Leptonychotes weddellii]|uniref:Sorting and assembly machinery component 50 homolog n=1 Tax=Leptonychotes weddellii TaxID=9713 RepID=A0A7F8PWE9_LEPWE|nr:sorting and assembly machinery component 50 homolog [Leptonychotes weddellii]
MGTVHARSLEPLPANGPDFGALGEEAEFVEVEPEAKQEILENKDVVVQHVHFDGLGRTKDDIIICEIGDVFKAKNLIEVMRKSHEAREKLLRLGIFRQVDVLIDTCQGTCCGVISLIIPPVHPAGSQKLNIESSDTAVPRRSSVCILPILKSFAVGQCRRQSSTEREPHLFYLGGPTSVRGFSMHSVGPQSEGDYLGGEAYWAGGLHVYTPLPFRPGQGGFGELFRTHFFLNAGNLCNLNYGEGPKAHIRKLAECIRWSYGAGIVLRLGNIARLELNYCVPMGVQKGDRTCDGVQFGAGIRFL